MKKLTTILTITAAALMFSSCIIVGADDLPDVIIEEKTNTPKPSNPQPEPEPIYYHSITCKNQTSYTVTDWCVKKDNIVTYPKSGYNRSIRSGGEDMILDLLEGYYKVYFSFEDTYQLNPSDYYSSESIYLNKDVIYTLYERQVTVSCRAAGTAVKPQLYLAGSDGTEIDLVSE